MTEVKSFLGLVGYYRRFVKDFSKITSPLINLLTKMTKFEWADKCKEVFQELKITTMPILSLPTEGKV